MTSSGTRKNNQSTAPRKQSKPRKERRKRTRASRVQNSSSEPEDQVLDRSPRPSPPAPPRKRRRGTEGLNSSSESENQDLDEHEHDDSEDENEFLPNGSDQDDESDKSLPSSDDDRQTESQRAKKAIAHQKTKAPLVLTPPNIPNVELFNSRNDPISTTKTRTPRDVEDLVQPTPDGILSIAVEATKPLATRYALFEAPFPTGDVKATQIARWWKQAVAEEQPELRKTGVPKSFSTAVSVS
jgi:hypothetical protein